LGFDYAALRLLDRLASFRRGSLLPRPNPFASPICFNNPNAAGKETSSGENQLAAGKEAVLLI
jgi:hypothetical protein